MKSPILWTLLLIFFIGISSYFPANANAPEISPQTVICSIIEEADYEMSSRMIPYSAQNKSQELDETAWVVEEYNVLYNLARMPVGYEIPTVLKSFAMSNNINGVEIVPNIGDIHGTDIAVVKKQMIIRSCWLSVKA